MAPGWRWWTSRDVAGSLGAITYAELEARARGMARHFDDLGVAQGERVAIVSPNSARFLTSFFGVSGYGRVLVPINFRLSPTEIAYIVEHSGASVLLVRPRARRRGRRHPGARTASRSTESMTPRCSRRPPRAPQPGSGRGEEDATCSVNYTSGTTARPKGVQLTHRNCWLNAVTFGWHTGVGDRDVLLHTLPMFHCNGWGMPYAVTGMGGTHIVLRKVDGEEILSRVERHGVTLLCGAPAVVAAILDAAAAGAPGRAPFPGEGTVRIVVAGAPPPSKAIERVETELGWEFIQIYGLTETAPLLTVNRAPAEWDGVDAGRALAPAEPRRRPGHRRTDRGRRRGRGPGPLQPCLRRVLGAAGGDGAGARRRVVPHRRRRLPRRAPTW